MSRTEHLIPKPGLKVVDPTTFVPLPAEGKPVELDTYWHRRIADGDVSVKTHAPAKSRAPAVKE